MKRAEYDGGYRLWAKSPLRGGIFVGNDRDKPELYRVHEGRKGDRVRKDMP